MCANVLMQLCYYESRRGGPDSLELGLQVVVSFLTWLRGSKFRSSATRVITAISLAPRFTFDIYYWRLTTLSGSTKIKNILCYICN